MRFNKIETRVQEILVAIPKCRDSDSFLYAKYIYIHFPKLAEMPLYVALQDKELPSYETITRCRRKLQENYPELRGRNYRGRQEKQEEYIEYAKL